LTGTFGLRSWYRRLPLLSRVLAWLYLVWSCLVYFASMTGEHEWWPLFLYPLIWPLGLVYNVVSWPMFEMLVPVPNARQYMLYDHISGAFYIVGGTIWLTCLGLALTVLAKRVLGFRTRD
jgi:hypothetical protein